MPKKSAEERLEAALKKVRQARAEINSKKRKERTHLLVLHGVQIEKALEKLNKPLNDIQNLGPELSAKLHDCYVKALTSFYAELEKTEPNQTSNTENTNNDTQDSDQKSDTTTTNDKQETDQESNTETTNDNQDNQGVDRELAETKNE